MSAWEVVAGAALGVAATEFTDISPWLAKKLVRWAAYRWTADPDIAAMYAEEWTAIVEERPGKLLKLFTALQFSIGAASKATPRLFALGRDAVVRLLMRVTGLPEGGVHDIKAVALTGAGAMFGLGLVGGYMAPSLSTRQGWIFTLITFLVGAVLGVVAALWIRRKRHKYTSS